MSAPNLTSEQVRRAFELGPRGAVGLADSLLALARGRKVRIDHTGTACVVTPEGAGVASHTVPMDRKSIFRAALAHIAMLCNRRSPGAATPYAGQGELTPLRDPLSVYRVEFTNTPDDQRLEAAGPDTGPAASAERIWTLPDAARCVGVPVRVVADMCGMERPHDQFELNFLQLAKIFLLAPVLRLSPDGFGASGRLGDCRLLEDRPFRPPVLSTATIETLIHTLTVSQPRDDAGRFAARVRELVASYGARVDTVDGLPARLYPFTQRPSPGAPRAVVIDPAILSGRPSVAGTPVDSLAGEFWSGASVAGLAAKYRLAAEAIEEAVRYNRLVSTAPLHSWD